MAEEGYSILNWVPSNSGSKLGERLSIRVLKSAASNARLGREEEFGALKRLDAQARLLEHHASGPPVEKLIAEERERSDSYGDKCVFGWALKESSYSSDGPQEFSRVTG